MKTSLDFPDSLYSAVKARAVRDNMPLHEVFVDLVRRGLTAVGSDGGGKGPTIGTDRITGLPVIECAHERAGGGELTPQRVADILLDQEVTWHRDAAG